MAATVIMGSAVFAALMVLVFALLTLRRWQSERRIKRNGGELIAATRAYLARIHEQPVDRLAAAIAEPIRLDAVLNLSRLLRGSERDKLIGLAVEDGLFDLALRDLASGRERQRIQAVALLEQFDNPKCIHALSVTLASDPVYQLRLAAAFALARFGQLPPPRDLISLLSLRTSENHRVQIALFRSLAPHAARSLRELARDPQFTAVRAALIDALGWTGEAACLDEISEAARDPDPDVRCAALRAAGQLGHQQAAPWVIALLDDSDDNVRIQALKCAARLALAQALPQIEALAASPSSWIRWRAEEALAALRPARWEQRS